MGYIIIESRKYIKVKSDGKFYGTSDREQATEFASTEQAKLLIDMIPKGRQKNCLIVDVDNQKQYKIKDGIVVVRKRSKHGKEIRKYIYDKADGRCELCGRKILMTEMTLDHVVPLGMGGRDEIANLQCACRMCNHLKDNLPPEEYADWVKESFAYQARKRSRKSLRWMIAVWAVKGI